MASTTQASFRAPSPASLSSPAITQWNRGMPRVSRVTYSRYASRQALEKAISSKQSGSPQCSGEQLAIPATSPHSRAVLTENGMQTFPFTSNFATDWAGVGIGMSEQQPIMPLPHTICTHKQPPQKHTYYKLFKTIEFMNLFLFHF